MDDWWFYVLFDRFQSYQDNGTSFTVGLNFIFFV